MGRPVVPRCFGWARRRCRDRGPLSSAPALVTVSPGALSFVDVYCGASAAQALAVANSGAGGAALTVSLDGGAGFAFAGSSALSLAPGQAVSLAVTFTPQIPGLVQAILGLSGPAGTLAVQLTGNALALRSCCAADRPRDAVQFDPDAGACVHATLADGVTCASSSLCLEATHCQAGSLRSGRRRICDDHDACTSDACVEGLGCQHQDVSASCAGEQPCAVYGCEPVVGCVTASAVDGTPCALDESCKTAGICAAGSCVGTAVPDGVPCRLWWEPCALDATCQRGACDSKTADAEQPGQLRWDAGLSEALGPFAVDDAGTALFTAAEPIDGGSISSCLWAFDACGKQLWTNDRAPFAGVMLDDGQDIGWTSDGRGGQASPAAASVARSCGRSTWGAALGVWRETEGPVSPGRRARRAGAFSAQGLLYLPVSGNLQRVGERPVPTGAGRRLSRRPGGSGPRPSRRSPSSGVAVDPLGNVYLSAFDLATQFMRVLGFDASRATCGSARACHSWATGLSIRGRLPLRRRLRGRARPRRAGPRLPAAPAHALPH